MKEAQGIFSPHSSLVRHSSYLELSSPHLLPGRVHIQIMGTEIALARCNLYSGDVSCRKGLDGLIGIMYSPATNGFEFAVYLSVFFCSVPMKPHTRD